MPILPYINLPQNNVPDLLNSIGDTLVSAAQRKKQQEKDAADLLLRQQTQAREDRLATAQIGNYQSEAEARKSEAEMRKAAQDRENAAQMATARQGIMAALQAGKPDVARQIAATYGVKLDQQTPPRPQLAGNTIMPPTAVDLTAPPAPGQDASAVEGANAQAIASNQPAAPKPQPWNIAGVPYDPTAVEAADDAERAKIAERSRAAYQPLGYGDTAAALVQGSTGNKMPEIDTLIAQRMKADQAAKDREDEKARQREFQDQQNQLYRRTFPQAMALADKQAQGRVSAAQAIGGARQDQADLAAYKHVDATVHQAVQESGMPKLLQTKELLDLANTELDRPSGAAQIGARMAIERALRGGPPTQYMDEQERNHIGGFQARMEGALQTLATGEMGDAQKQAVRQEIAAARAEYDRFLDRRAQSIGGRLARDPSLQNMQGTVNERWKQTMANYGREVPDLFQPGQNANALPAIGSRSVAATQAPPAKTNPLIEAAQRPGRAAARKQMMSPAAAEAKAWLQANPNDPKAEAVRAKLKSMGELQ